VNRVTTSVQSPSLATAAHAGSRHSPAADPDRETTFSVIEAGVGVPTNRARRSFSGPDLADGPVVQAAAQRALAQKDDDRDFFVHRPGG